MLNLGGPDNQAAVEPFLYNLFADPDIIKLPASWLLQKPLAWRIARSRGRNVRASYQTMGGGSPILPLTQAQAQALETRLRGWGIDTRVYIAMRYWHPFTEEAVAQMQADGVTELVVLPLYPQFSYTTTGSSVGELKKILAQRSLTWPITVIPPYFLDEDYLGAMAEALRDGLEASGPWSVPNHEVQVLFSAHSLPLRHIKRTGDPYPQQIKETAQALMQRYFPENPWELAYQSKVGKMAWLGPDTEGLLHYFAATGVQNVLMVPLSFVSDHLETLYEIDGLYIPMGLELGIAHCRRVRALNSQPSFIAALAKLVAPAFGLPANTPICGIKSLSVC